LRILFFYASEIEALGGAQISVLGLAEALARAGHSTAILEFAAKKGQRQLSRKVPVWSIPWVTDPRPRSPRSWARFLRCVWQFLRVVREFKPDIVSVQFPAWQSPPVVAAYALPRKWRLVVTVHGSDIRVISFSQPTLRPWLIRLFIRADAVTAVSESLLRDALHLYPFVRNKAHLIHNGVSPSWFENETGVRSGDADQYILSVGSFVRVKGTDLLLRAWALIQTRVPGLTLKLVGTGPELENLHTLSEELGVSHSIRFVGKKEQLELRSLYRDAKLVVIPSRNEGLPGVALEAGACGAVCVATRVGGLAEIIEEGITGFLVAPESPEALAEGILTALELPVAEKKRMGAAATSRMKLHFKQETMVANYERLFQSLMGA
jgi:colanic acid/amylovoran biosynthesis glycosyltransferase